MKREELIAFLKHQFIGDLEAKLDASLEASSDEQLATLYKALIAEDPEARKAAQVQMVKQQAQDAPKIDVSKLKKPTSTGGGGRSGGSGGEQVW